MIPSLCGFVVYYEAFHVQSYVPPCSHLLSVLFSIVITSLGEERAGIYASRAFVCLFCMYHVLYFYLPLVTWCRGLAADCGCGTPWTFHFSFLT